MKDAMRISDVLAKQSDHSLAQAVCEIAAWRRTGRLAEGELHAIAGECGEFDLRQIESEILLLVALRWAASVASIDDPKSDPVVAERVKLLYATQTLEQFNGAAGFSALSFDRK